MEGGGYWRGEGKPAASAAWTCGALGRRERERERDSLRKVRRALLQRCAHTDERTNADGRAEISSLGDSPSLAGEYNSARAVWIYTNRWSQPTDRSRDCVQYLLLYNSSVRVI